MLFYATYERASFGFVSRSHRLWSKLHSVALRLLFHCCYVFVAVIAYCFPHCCRSNHCRLYHVQLRTLTCCPILCFEIITDGFHSLCRAGSFMWWQARGKLLLEASPLKSRTHDFFQQTWVQRFGIVTSVAFKTFGELCK